MNRGRLLLLILGVCMPAPAALFHRSDNGNAERAPAIAGLEGFTDIQAETVLEKGIGPNGIEIQPPMHVYHMNRADSQAIIAYLRSLPSNYTNP